MKKEEFYKELFEKFRSIIIEEQLQAENVYITAKGMTPFETIGETKRKDYPILTGKEIMLSARFGEFTGQAFTSRPSAFTGSLDDIMKMDLLNDMNALGLWAASVNAVMSYLGRADRTVHCRNDGPELCAQKAAALLKGYGKECRIVMVGYQPSLLEALSRIFRITVLEINSELTGMVKSGCPVIESNEKNMKILDEADLILCTGSTLCNYTIMPYIERKEKVLFYGTTIAGTAVLADLKRLCFTEE